MIYQLTVTENSGGSSASPTVTRMKVTKGLVYHVEIYFPPGSSGLAGLRVKDADHQIWPSTNGEYFIGDDQLLVYPERYWKTIDPTYLNVETYNEDTAYNHKMILRVGMLSAEDLIRSYVPEKADSKEEEILEALQELVTLQSIGVVSTLPRISE